MKDGTTGSPAARQASIGQDVIEGALLQLKDLPPRVNRVPITAAFERALSALTRLRESGLSDPNHMQLLSDVQVEVRRTRGIVWESDRGRTATRIAQTLEDLSESFEETRAETINQVVAAQQVAALDRARDDAAFSRPFCASMGSPRLHAPVRATLTPAVDVLRPEHMGWEEPVDVLADVDREVLEADDGASDLAPLEADSEEAAEEEALGALERELRPRGRELFVVGQAPKNLPLDDAMLQAGLPGELAQLRRLARDCMEEIGALGTLRSVRDRDRWMGIARFDQRLLNDLDAVVALGETFCRSDARPGGLAHGSLNVLGELLDHTHDSLTVDTARAFARAFVLGCVEGDDTTRAAVVSLKQSPVLTHAAQASALGLSSSASVLPAMRRLCLEGRGDLIKVALDVLWARADVDLATILTLLEHPDVSVRERAARCLGYVNEWRPATELLISMIEGEVEDTVMAAMVESLMVLRPTAALFHIRERLGEDLEDPGILEPGVRLRLARLLGVGGEAADAELLQRLFENEPAVAEALGWHGHPSHIEPLLAALQRVEPGLRRVVTRALRRITGADLRTQVDVGPDVYDQPLDAYDWRVFWQASSQHFSKVYRYRFGAPFTIAQTIEELSVDGAPMGARRLGALEIAILCEEPCRLRVDDWAARQLAELDRLRRGAVSARTDGGHPVLQAMAGRWLPDWPKLGLDSEG